MALMTIDEAAAIARVHERTIRKWIDTGRLDALELGNGPRPRIRIDSSALGRLLVDSAARRVERREAAPA